MNFAYFFRMLSYNTCDHLINVLTSEDEQALEVICQSKLLETKKNGDVSPNASTITKNNL